MPFPHHRAAMPIVEDGDEDPAILHLDAQVRLAGPGMLGDVGQRLVEEVGDERGRMRIEHDVRMAVRRQPDRNLRPGRFERARRPGEIADAGVGLLPKGAQRRLEVADGVQLRGDARHLAFVRRELLGDDPGGVRLGGGPRGRVWALVSRERCRGLHIQSLPCRGPRRGPHQVLHRFSGETRRGRTQRSGDSTRRLSPTPPGGWGSPLVGSNGDAPARGARGRITHPVDASGPGNQCAGPRCRPSSSPSRR